MPAIHGIERVAFSDPWSARDFEESLREGVPFLVADVGGEVVGYVVALVGADEGEILNLAVAATVQRRGIGRTLTTHMLDELRARGARHIYLEVRESNGAAQALYSRVGFRQVGRRARYYRQPVEDAVVLRHDA